MHLILTLSTDPEVRSLIRDGAHKKWHLIRTIWIREKYRTLGTNRYCSEILSRNRKVEFKCTNECKQQDFHSIIHTIKPFRTQHSKKNTRLTLKVKIEYRYKLGDPQQMSLGLTRFQVLIGQHLEYLSNAQVYKKAGWITGQKKKKKGTKLT